MKKVLLTLIMSITLFGSLFAQQPETHWPDFYPGPWEDYVIITAFIQIDSSFIDEEDNWANMEIASFCGDECRGTAFMTYEGDTHPIVALQFWFNSDSATSEVASFKLYNHSTGMEYDISTCNYQITGGDSNYIQIYLSNYDEAVVINFITPTTTQTTQLYEGFNWFSIYVEGDPFELLAQLQDNLAEHGISIESLTDGLQENLGDGLWMGDLDYVGLTNEQMYMIEVDADCTVELVGAPANPANHEITLNPGEVTWIGYPYSEEVDILVALSGLEAEEGDMIEGLESGVAEYLGDGFWMGFDTMVPGQGYMYTSNGTEVKTFVYNTEAEAKVRRAQKLGLGQHKFIKSLNSIIDTTKKNPNVIKKN